MAALQDAAKTELLPGEEVIDEVTLTIGPEKVSRKLLTVDKDDVIKTVLWFEEKGRATTKPEVVEYLGQRVLHSGKLSVAGLLPKGRVATIARRVTFGNITRIHVIVAWGFEQAHRSGAVAYTIYVFAEDLRSKSVKLSHSEKEVNRQLLEFLVRDINNDGLPEIIDFGRSAKIGDIHIRRLEHDGKVTRIQDEEAYQAYILGPIPDDGHTILLLEDEVDPGRWPDQKCYSYRELRWSPEKAQFITKK